MSPRGALAMLCHAPRARILCKKYHAGDMCARRRERMLKSFRSRRRHWHRRMDVLSSTSPNAWQEWDAAHIPRERVTCRTRRRARFPEGGPILTCKIQYTIIVFPLSMDLLSSTSQNVWQEWDAARTPRPPIQSLASPGPPRLVLTCPRSFSDTPRRSHR